MVGNSDKLFQPEVTRDDIDYYCFTDANDETSIGRNGVWVNLIIKDGYIYNRIDELIKEEVNLALIKHPSRDCAYQEAYNCIAGCKAKWRDLLRQIIFLKRNGFPEHWGLFEANVIFRKHNEPVVQQLDELWWKTFMKYSKRDQLSLVYSLWSTGIDISFFLPKEYSTLNHPSFQRLEHLPQRDSNMVKFKKKLIGLVLKSAKRHLKEPTR